MSLEALIAECNLNTTFKVVETETPEGLMKLEAKFADADGKARCLRVTVTDPTQSDLAKASFYDACLKSMKRTQ